MKHGRASVAERGSALVAALFLIVVVAALGMFAMRTTTDQAYTMRLDLLQIRAEAAANTGLEFGSNRARPPWNSCINHPPFVIDTFTITVTCTAISSDALNVYELVSTASAGNYGQPDFVQRRATRVVSNIGPGTW